MRKHMMWAPALLLALAVGAQPAAAQGKAKGHGKHAPAGQAKSQKHERDRDRDRGDRERREGRAVGTAGPAMRFQGLDANHDGRIERSEWRGDDRSFQNHDWNHDGVLSGDEVKPGARRPPAAPRPATPVPPQGGGEPDEVLFARLDVNQDGVLTRAEWKSTDAEFRRLDFNHDGVISPYEFGVGR